MSFERKLSERPPAKKRFVTVRDVHEMAAAGTRELATGPDIVITEAAREAAIDHGIRLVPETAQSAAVAPAVASIAPAAPIVPVAPVAQAAARSASGAVPGNAVPPATATASGSGSAPEIVDAIVEAFRRSDQLDPSEREVREVAKRVLSAGIGRGK